MSLEGPGRQRDCGYRLKPDLCTKRETRIAPQFLLDPQQGWGGEGAGTCPTWAGARQGREGLSGASSPAHQVHPTRPSPHQVHPGPLHAPTLHHQPSFAHGAAHVVLGDAKVVPSILWAGADNLQLSAGQNLGTRSWIGWRKWGGASGWGHRTPRWAGEQHGTRCGHRVMAGTESVQKWTQSPARLSLPDLPTEPPSAQADSRALGCGRRKEEGPAGRRTPGPYGHPPSSTSLSETHLSGC